MPIDPEIEREVEALRRKSGAIATEFDRVVGMLATRQAELDRVRREAEGYRAQGRAVLLDAAAEVREITRFMRDFERAATVEATARDSWRHLNTLASEQDAIADQLSASCDELRNTKNRLSSALHISSTELAAAFAKARAAPMQPATGTPNERHTAEYLASVMPKPLSPTTACTSGPAADRSPTQTFLSDLPTLTTKASSTIELSDQGSRGKQRSAMPKPARTRGLPAARLVLAIACFLALVFLLTALIAST